MFILGDLKLGWILVSEVTSLILLQIYYCESVVALNVGIVDYLKEILVRSVTKIDIRPLIATKGVLKYNNKTWIIIPYMTQQDEYKKHGEDNLTVFLLALRDL